LPADAGGVGDAINESMPPKGGHLTDDQLEAAHVLIVRRGASTAAVGTRSLPVAYEHLAPGDPPGTFQFLKDGLK